MVGLYSASPPFSLLLFRISLSSFIWYVLSWTILNFVFLSSFIFLYLSLLSSLPLFDSVFTHFSDVLFTLVVVHLLRHVVSLYQLSVFIDIPISVIDTHFVNTQNQLFGELCPFSVPHAAHARCRGWFSLEIAVRTDIVSCDTLWKTRRVQTRQGQEEFALFCFWFPDSLPPIVRPSPCTGVIPNASFFRKATSVFTKLPRRKPDFELLFLGILEDGSEIVQLEKSNRFR